MLLVAIVVRHAQITLATFMPLLERALLRSVLLVDPLCLNNSVLTEASPFTFALPSLKTPFEPGMAVLEPALPHAMGRPVKVHTFPGSPSIRVRGFPGTCEAGWP